MMDSKRSALLISVGQRYFTAVLCVALAFTSTKLLWPWIEPHPDPLFLAAVAISAWYGGLGASLLSTLLSDLAVDYFFTPPLGSLEMSWDNAIRTFVFMLVGLLISGIDAARKRALDERDRLLVRERAARKEAETANRAKDEFLAMVTHELRAPLSVILGWAKMLRSGALDEPASKLALEKIERNAESQQHLVDDLLDVSRFVTGKFAIDPHLIELVTVIEDAIDSVAYAAQAKNIQLHRTLERGSMRVHGDANRLRQLIWNLLSNAIKFTPEGGSVQINLTRSEHYAEIDIVDTGCGIRAEVLPHIFERFHQEENAKLQGGLGLGLAIVHHIAEMHGWSVEAASQGEGQGASFTIRMPFVSEEASNVLPRTKPAFKFQISGG